MMRTRAPSRAELNAANASVEKGCKARAKGTAVRVWLAPLLQKRRRKNTLMAAPLR